MIPTWRPMPLIRSKPVHLLREAGYPDGLAVTLIASEALEVQATVVGKMLEQVGFTVELQMLDAAAFNRKTRAQRSGSARRATSMGYRADVLD